MNTAKSSSGRRVPFQPAGSDGKHNNKQTTKNPLVLGFVKHPSALGRFQGKLEQGGAPTTGQDGLAKIIFKIWQDKLQRADFDKKTTTKKDQE